MLVSRDILAHDAKCQIIFRLSQTAVQTQNCPSQNPKGLLFCLEIEKLFILLSVILYV